MILDIFLTCHSILLAVSVINVEVTIIGTSLVTIVESLHGFERQGWIVTGNLAAYTNE